MDDRRMPFTDHLRDLRSCLRNAVVALVVAVVVTFTWSQELYVLLARPLINAWHKAGLGEPQLKFGSLIEPFWVQFELSLYAGIFLASPVIFYQLWKFIAPGLYEKERRIAIPFALTSALFFVGGALFCYLLVFPKMFGFLLTYATKNASHVSGLFGYMEADLAKPLAIEPNLFMQQYLDLTTKMLLGFGLVFELPLVLFTLSYVGLVTHRGLWKFNKYAIILSFVIGAILTPGPDIISQLFMAGAMIALYNLSLLAVFVVTRKRERAQVVDAGSPS
jgi:sec-independent protein translocase protein TatC